MGVAVGDTRVGVGDDVLLFLLALSVPVEQAANNTQKRARTSKRRDRVCMGLVDSLFLSGMAEMDFKPAGCMGYYNDCHQMIILLLF